MNIGMLWFDNDKKSELDAKIERAASYYQNKYGKAATVCYVHPSMLPPAEAAKDSEESTHRSGDIVVRASKSVLPNHFWIGVNGVNHSPGS